MQVLTDRRREVSGIVGLDYAAILARLRQETRIRSRWRAQSAFDDLDSSMTSGTGPTMRSALLPTVALAIMTAIVVTFAQRLIMGESSVAVTGAVVAVVTFAFLRSRTKRGRVAPPHS